MTSEKLHIFKRKLTAILSADAEGYSRLMGEDEDRTVRTLKTNRELLANLIKKHNGRVIDSPGDNLLAEFGSVVDAVRCAVEIQEEIKERNADVPENHRMEFRIGVNLGDVIEDENRIYGDGVNIAARLEGLADGGGICISGRVYKQVKNKLTLGYEYLGERTVKNIAEPIKVYRVLIEPDAVGKVIGEKRTRLKGRQRAVVAIIAMLVVAATVVVLNFYWRSAPLEEKTGSIAKTTTPLAERASIAVLPFKNLSDDTEQEYFSDGITNDIITDLSKFREMLVIASNTVFTYKGKPVKAKEVSRELGVRYVLEGSVQKLSHKVRINAQLIDATTEHHLWAERFDRDLNDIFAVQNEIVQTIVTTLAIKVGKAERARAMYKDTDNLEAYDYLLRGWEHHKQRTRSKNVKAKEMFKKAIELDPAYANAYVALARSYVSDLGYGWTEFPAQTRQKALDLVNKALTLDESNAGAHALLGIYYVYQGEYELAFSELRRAIDLNPNDASSHHTLGWVMLYSGHTDEAIDALKTALRFDPNTSPSAYLFLGIGHYLKEQYDSAIKILKKGVGRKADFVDLHVALAATYAQSGRQEDAVREVKTVLELNPFFEAGSYGTVYRNPADRDKIIAGLRKAGLK
jgi:adenylate cyclase